MGVRQRMFSPDFTLHLSGRFCPSAIPDACAPRNDGQFPSDVFAFGALGAFAVVTKEIFLTGIVFGSSAGAHRLRSRIIRRTRQSSAITSKPTRLASSLTR